MLNNEKGYNIREAYKDMKNFRIVYPSEFDYLWNDTSNRMKQFKLEYLNRHRQ